MWRHSQSCSLTERAGCWFSMTWSTLTAWVHMLMSVACMINSVMSNKHVHVFNLIPAELEEKLSDYTHCTVSQLSLPHPITSPLSTSTPTHSISTTCECRAPLTGLQNKSDNSALSDEFKTTCCGSHGDTSADSATVSLIVGLMLVADCAQCQRVHSCSIS